MGRNTKWGKGFGMKHPQKRKFAKWSVHSEDHKNRGHKTSGKRGGYKRKWYKKPSFRKSGLHRNRRRRT